MIRCLLIFLLALPTIGASAVNGVAGASKVNGITVSKVNGVLLADITTGLIARYALDEASGDAVDSSGNSRTMTQNGTVGAGSGAYANSRGTYATANYFGRTDSAFELNNGDWTITGWVYLNSLAAASVVFANNNSSGGAQVSYLLAPQTDGTFAATVYNTSNTSFNAITTNTLTTSTWAFFVGTYTSATKVVTSQLNGGSVAAATLTGTVKQPSGFPATIGAQPYSGFEFPTAGYLAKIRIYNRVLTAGEISTLYNGGTFSTAP